MRRPGRSILLLALALALPASWTTAAADGRAIAGRAEVITGDSFSIEGTVIRLYGIDAFERSQACGDPAWPCGEAARDRLVELVAGGDVTCELRTTDRWGRAVAICAAGAMDVAEILVAEGLAVAWRKVSDRYVATERSARAAKIGVWSGPFTFPWDFRRETY